MLEHLERMIYSVVAVLALILCCAGAEPGLRDPWLQPFASRSIWNMPIGAGAEYVPAGLPAPAQISCDEEWIICTSSNDPVFPVYQAAGWAKRWPGKRQIMTMHFPDSLVVPDIDPPNTPNNCAAFLLPDGRTVRQMAPICRISTGLQLVAWVHPEDQDLYGEGIKGTHYGSGLSTLGGSIRRGELISVEPLKHVIKLNVHAKYLYYSPQVKGYRWPADRSDSYAHKVYQGGNTSLVMGALLALHPDCTTERFNVSTVLGRKIFQVLQDYGAYIADDSACNTCAFCVEVGVKEEVLSHYNQAMNGYSGVFVDEMKRMVAALMIINNNRPESIGGGGVLRRPLAPELVPPRK